MVVSINKKRAREPNKQASSLETGASLLTFRELVGIKLLLHLMLRINTKREDIVVRASLSAISPHGRSETNLASNQGEGLALFQPVTFKAVIHDLELGFNH